jgi:hypothetical protein
VIWVNLPVKFRQSNNKNTGAWIIHAPFFMLFMMHRYTTILLFTLFSCGMLAQQDSLIMSVPDTLKTSQDSIFVPDTSQFKTDFRKKFSLRWHMHPHSPASCYCLLRSFSWSRTDLQWKQKGRVMF